MLLWLISQNENNDYDTYDSAVVAAETAEEASRMHPRDGSDIKNNESYHQTWTHDPTKVICKLIGTAAPRTPKSVICASFNAG